MQPSATSIKTMSPYENQARAAALHWSQLALSTGVAEFDIVSCERQDMHGTILGSHRLTVEHQTRRWCGRVIAGLNDIVCSTREEFDEGLKQQGLLALYNQAAHDNLTESIACAPYSEFRKPSYRPVASQRLLYRRHCDDCHASGTRTCANCRGEGETNCSACTGDGNQSCGACGGAGQVEVGRTDHNGDYYPEPGDCSVSVQPRHLCKAI